MHIPVFLCDSSVLGVWTGHQAAVMLGRHTATRYHAWTLMAVVAVAAMGGVATVGVASEAEVVGEALLVAAAAAGGATLAEASAVVTLVAVASEVVEATVVVTRETGCSSACGCVHSPTEISLRNGACCNSVDNLNCFQCSIRIRATLHPTLSAATTAMPEKRLSALLERTSLLQFMPRPTSWKAMKWNL